MFANRGEKENLPISIVCVYLFTDLLTVACTKAWTFTGVDNFRACCVSAKGLRVFPTQSYGEKVYYVKTPF